MDKSRIKKLVKAMTLEEKAGLCSGSDFWHTKSIGALDIPSIMLSDGPHGLRKQDENADHLGVNESIKAVCFPAACATAASFNKEAIYKMGEALGKECQAEDVAVLLGPGVNIKRSPLCGRNFEYFSEDPYLAGEMAAAHINGVQSQGVGTSIKHFLANNQEYRRLTNSSNVDERTLNEIYMTAFEIAIKKAKPWTVMCSYNRINGKHVSESYEYLTKVLRHFWEFDGFVVSDWGAVNRRVEGLEAGLDLEMPASDGVNDRKIVEAVKSKRIKEDVLDDAVERILEKVFLYQENRKPDTKWDMEADHKLAREIEEESIVLLKNDNILPLKNEGKVAFIGKYATKPRYQGGGSSHINSFKTESAVDAVINESYGVNAQVVYAQGYEDKSDTINEALIDEAVRVASQADVAVVFAGLPDNFESEGYDRQHMKMPECQNHLIEAVSNVQPNTIVILHNGSPVEMPWINRVKGVIEAYLGGQAVGGAIVNVLFGFVNPSGKLPETFPKRVEDNPSYIFFQGEKNDVDYREGIFVGYRYYDKKNMEVLFPFGYGLSYTTFQYSNLTVDKDFMDDSDVMNVSIDITNTGDVAGKEVVELYIQDMVSSVIRPTKELKGFDKVYLEPGETKTVNFQLDKRAFAYYSLKLHNWYVETGDFNIQIGSSSRDIRAEKMVHVNSTIFVPEIFDMNTTLGDIAAYPQLKELFAPIFKSYIFGAGDEECSSPEGSAANEAITKEMEAAMFDQMPIRCAFAMGDGTVTLSLVEDLLEQANKIVNGI